MTAADRVITSLDDTLGWQEEVYLDLHRHPELSMQEERTNGVIADRLTEFGYEIVRIGGGVVGVLANGEGPTVLFRADTDALPVTEDTGLEYASTNDGVMHACGHDMHVACALGAAALLARHRDAWSGTYVALFQPAEETAAGAQAMVDAGLTDAIPRPDVALGQHVMPTPAGTLLVGAGTTFSQADSLRVTVFGHGSHGSMPHLGVDPVVLASTIVLRLQTIVARDIAPSDFGVVTVGSLHAGSKSNVISDRAELLLNVRTYDPDVRTRILERIEHIIRTECEGARSPQPPVIEYYDQFPLTENDDDVTAKVRGALQDVFGEDAVRLLKPLTGSEDFSIVPRAFGIPYTYWCFGGFSDGEVIPNHNPRFAPLIHPTLPTGTKAAVAAALAWLGH